MVGNMSVFCSAVAAGLSSAVAGGVAGSVEAVFVILISAAVCYWRSEQFFSLIFLCVVSHDGYIRVERERESNCNNSLHFINV